MSNTIRSTFGLNGIRYYQGDKGQPLVAYDPTNQGGGSGDSAYSADQEKEVAFRLAHPDISLEDAKKDPTFSQQDFTSPSFLQSVVQLAKVPLMAFGASFLAPTEAGVGALEMGGLGSDLALAPGAGALSATGTGVIDSAVNAATTFLKGYLEPEVLASRVGQQLVGQGVTNILSGRELTAGMSLEGIAKGTALGALSGAAGAGLSSGLQMGTGMSAPTANNLSRAGVTALRGGDPRTAGLAALGTSLGLAPTTASQLAPVVSGFVQGKTPDIKGALLSGVLDQIKIPDWTGGAKTGLEWVDRGIKGGVNRAIGTGVRKAIS